MMNFKLYLSKDRTGEMGVKALALEAADPGKLLSGVTPEHRAWHKPIIQSPLLPPPPPPQKRRKGQLIFLSSE